MPGFLETLDASMAIPELRGFHWLMTTMTAAPYIPGMAGWLFVVRGETVIRKEAMLSKSGTL